MVEFIIIDRVGFYEYLGSIPTDGIAVRRMYSRQS